MTKPIIYVDRSDVHMGAEEALRAAVTRLVAFIEEREPQLLYYGFHIDADASTMWLTAVHPDPASLSLHLRIGGPEFLKVGEFITLRTIDVYGEPDEDAVVLLQQKARMLGGATLAVHPLAAGFARILGAAS